jgi:hypothetical protein
LVPIGQVYPVTQSERWLLSGCAEALVCDEDEMVERGQPCGDFGQHGAAFMDLAAVAIGPDGEDDLRLDLVEAVDDAAAAEFGGADGPDGAEAGRGEERDDGLRNIRAIADNFDATAAT